MLLGVMQIWTENVAFITRFSSQLAAKVRLRNIPVIFSATLFPRKGLVMRVCSVLLVVACHERHFWYE